MAEFLLQENPEVSPKRCYFCDSFEGPFVNSLTYDPTGRIILLCAPQKKGRRKSGCAGAITHQIDGLTPAAAQEVRVERQLAEEKLERAEYQLARLRESVSEAVLVD